MMNTSEEWKSLWSISSVHSPPLLLSPATTIDAVNKFGPLIFNPSPEPPTHHHLISSLSVPHIPPPVSNLSLPRFLQTSSSIIPSTITSIASQLSTSYSNPSSILAHNSLQLLRCPGSNSTLAFFPTGPNSDEIGFVILSIKNSQLKVRGVDGSPEAFTTKNALDHRIVKISVNPLADCDFNSGDCTIGYLLVSTTHSAHYYNISIIMHDSGEITPSLDLIADKLFKSSAIVNACWSPHIPEESVVLLDSGDLFLFDLDSCSRPSVSSPKLTGAKLKASWDDSTLSEHGEWLSCDFSWHPRILIVVHSTVTFLVDSRSDKCKVIPLLKIGANDSFLAFSIAAPDRFHFTLASNHTVFLCDIRKPMIPLLRWTHHVDNPSYIMVSNLSKLRSHCEDTTYNWASESGYTILLGSFWNCEFSLFCYGPDVREESLDTGCGKSFYAWGLPSDLSLVNDCQCGSCIVKKEYYKDMFPGWINWQQKKEIVLGFGILDSEISSQLYEPDGFGGFVVITLTSFGNLESHRYCASWDYSLVSEKGHGNQDLDLEDSFLYDSDEEEGYKFKKIFYYLKLDWLEGYLKSDLSRMLSKELVKNSNKETLQKENSFGEDFHEIICQKLKTFQGDLTIHDVFSDVSSPTSIHEIALRKSWANLPKKYLQFGFTTHSNLQDYPMKLKQLPLQFLELPCHQSHLPPFILRSPSYRSSKWSEKQKPTNALVGPVLPLPFLITFHKTQMLKSDNLPADVAIDQECDEVMKVANEVTSSSLGFEGFNSNVAVSLADDNEDMILGSESQQMFGMYKLPMEGNVHEDEKHLNLVFRVGQKDVKEVFDSHCPLKFKFDEGDMSFGPKEMKSYKLLKMQYSNFKKEFRSYQDYLTKSNIDMTDIDVVGQNDVGIERAFTYANLWGLQDN
ncbi:hypothetical protein LXL04_012925 [Taraxacum kok-saghyz]